MPFLSNNKVLTGSEIHTHIHTHEGNLQNTELVNIFRTMVILRSRIFSYRRRGRRRKKEKKLPAFPFLQTKKI